MLLSCYHYTIIFFSYESLEWIDKISNLILIEFLLFQKYSLWNSNRVDVFLLSSCDSFFNSFANTGIPQ